MKIYANNLTTGFDLVGNIVSVADNCTCSGGALSNGSFESFNKNNVPNDWEYNGKLSVDNGYKVCGKYNGLLTGAGSFWQDTPNVVPGSTVNLVIWGGYHQSRNQYFKLIFLGVDNSVLLSVDKKLTKSVEENGGNLTKYSLSGVAPEGTLKVRVLGITEGDYLKVDMVCLDIQKPVVECGTCVSNKLLNPDFESTITSGGKEIPADWEGVNFTKDAAYKVCGSKNGLITGAGSFYQDVPATTGSSVKLKIWAGYHTFKQQKIELLFFCAAGGSPISSVFVFLDKSVEDLGGKLKEYTLEGIAPLGTAYVRVKGSSNGDYFKVDNACLTIESPDTDGNACVVGDNILVNPSFEDGTSGWAKSGLGTFNGSNQYVVCGSLAGVGEGAVCISQDLSMASSDIATFQVWGGWKTTNAEQRACLIFLDINGAEISRELVKIEENLSNCPSMLKLYEVSKVAPIGTALVRVALESDGGEFRFDHAKLKIVKGTLPVKLVKFLASNQENVVKLAWTTTSESDAKEFEIQHSTNGKSWNVLGNVEAQGESNNTVTYSFNHQDPVSGNNFYRMKMIDLDGSFAWSNIIKVKLEGIAGVLAYPNPVSDYLHVEWGARPVSKIYFYDKNGVLIRTHQGNLNMPVNVKNLPNGFYLMRVEDGVGNFVTKRIQVGK